MIRIVRHIACGMVLCLLTVCSDDVPVSDMPVSDMPVSDVPVSDVQGQRAFDEEEIARLNASDRYDYDKAAASAPSPLLETALKIIAFIARLFHSFLGYAILIALVALLVWVITRNVRLPQKKEVRTYGPVRYHPDQELETTDYDRLLNEALQAGDHRLAVRYLYLLSLQYLQSARLIEWKKDKTNLEYYHELPDAYKSTFHQLAQVYEYVWYGQFEASSALSDRLKAYSDQLKRTAAG